jgi:hypothetical protein
VNKVSELNLAKDDGHESDVKTVCQEGQIIADVQLLGRAQSSPDSAEDKDGADREADAVDDKSHVAPVGRVIKVGVDALWGWKCRSIEKLLLHGRRQGVEVNVGHGTAEDAVVEPEDVLDGRQQGNERLRKEGKRNAGNTSGWIRMQMEGKKPAAKIWES